MRPPAGRPRAARNCDHVAVDDVAAHVAEYLHAQR
jgi:hypothetical protein